MSTTSQIVFEPLAVADRRGFEDLYRIYRESIPLPEQKPRAQLAALAARPDYRILLARKEGTVIGFSVLFLARDEPFCLLEYMAIDAAHRSGGAGAALFQQSVAAAAAAGDEAAVLLEVDAVRSGDPDRALCERRQRFYRRLGCRRVEGLAYHLPLPAAEPPPAMDLMVHLPPGRQQIEKPRLESWLTILYDQVYGCPPADPRIGRMMQTVGDPIRLA